MFDPNQKIGSLFDRRTGDLITQLTLAYIAIDYYIINYDNNV